MTTDPRISQLLIRWESLRNKGQTVTVDQLCDDCPELVDEMRKRVGAGQPGATVAETPGEHVTSSSPAGTIPATTGKAPYPNLPGFEFLGEVGRGGMGVVYKARQSSLNRAVAIKTILSGAHAGTRERARFYAEAEAVARLQHPNIVQIYDVSDSGGAPYFSMEYVDGPSLHKRLGGKPVDATTAAMLIETIALAIDYAHQRGVVHRDLKPANILMLGPPDMSLRECTPKITDFGLAKQLEEDVRLTQTGVVLGTPCYMAPEQVENPTADVHPAVDVYGLGALLYELLTGRPPFSAPTNFETMRQVVTDDPLPPSHWQPSVPEALDRICLKCLEKSPKKRYPSAAALADDIALFLEGERPTAIHERASGIRRRQRRIITPRSVVLPQQSWLARNWQLLALALLAVLFGAAGVAGVLHLRSDRARDGGVELAATGGLPVALPPIKVGVLHSLTGTMAISEQGVVDATRLAIDELNEAGGLLGRRIETIVRDGSSDPATFAAEAERLIEQDHVSAIFGCWTSASRKAVLPIVEKYDNMLLYPVEFEGLEQSPNIVYIGAVPNQQIIPALKWCSAFLDPPVRRYFLVGSDYVFPRTANEIIKDEVKSMPGASVVGEAYLPLGSSDVADVIRQIREAKPDIILNSINGDSNIAFFRALRAGGIKPNNIPVVSFSIGEPELRSMKIADLVGDYAARNYFQSIEGAENAKFLKRFWERYGSERVVGDAMESAYLGVHLWAQGVIAAGTDEPAKVLLAMRGQEYYGPGGKVLVDARWLNTHRVSRIGRIRADGQFDIVGSSETMIPPVLYPKTRTREEWDAFQQGLYQMWGGHWSGPDE